MQEYTVAVTRDTTESAEITVTADSPEHAEELALLASRADGVEWVQDDTANLSKDHYVSDTPRVTD